MAIDIIARGLATSLLGSDGKIASDKMPVMPSALTGSAFYPIGGIADAASVEGKTIEEVLLMMLYGVVSPTLTDPSLSIVLSKDNETLIIGHESTINGTLFFDRGAIAPAYGTSGFRAGEASSYTIMEEQILTNADHYDFSYKVIPTETQFALSYGVNYNEGEQPMNNIGQPVYSPLGAGALYGGIILSAAYPLYLENGELHDFTWFEEDEGSGYVSTFAKETLDNKQHFAVSKNLSVIGIKAYNFLTQQWEWLGGSAEKSLTHFDTTIITGDSLGETDDYLLYTHNQPATGERELRIYVE